MIQTVQKILVFNIFFLLVFASGIKAQPLLDFTDSRKWDGPFDIRMIAAPVLQGVYIDKTQTAAKKVKADSVITYETQRIAAGLFDINNDFKSAFPDFKVPLQALVCKDAENPCTAGLGPAPVTANCPGGDYSTPPTVTVKASMSYADYDNDNSTFSSSMALLDISKCSEIEAAYLYWTGTFKSGTGIILAPSSLNSYSGTPIGFDKVFYPTTTSKYDEVKLKIPGGSYIDVKATVKDPGDGAGSYLCVSDITNTVKGSGGGQFWVANVQSHPNDNSKAGWVIVVIYKSPLSPPRSIQLWNGFFGLSVGTKVDKVLSGFTAPATTDITSYIGFAAMDGENIASYELIGSQPEGLGFKTGGATFSLNPFCDGQQPKYKLWSQKGLPALVNGDDNITDEGCNTPIWDNTWPSVCDGMSSSHITSYNEITGKNGNEITRIPSNKNTLGLDVHHMKLPDGAVTAGATSATITVYAGQQGGTSPFLAYIAIERLQPKLVLTKLTDKNVTGLDSDISYTLRVANMGNTVSYINDIISDTLDPVTTFVAGSLTTKSYVNGVASNVSTVTVTSSANNILGLNIGQTIGRNDSIDIVFKVHVKDYLSAKALYDGCKRTILNTAWVEYKKNAANEKLKVKSNSSDCGIGSEVRILIQDPALNPVPVVKGPFVACAYLKESALTHVRKQLFAAGVLAADTADYDVRDALYERVRPEDLFPANTPSMKYYAILDLGGAGPTCQKLYEFEFTCSLCTPPTTLTISPKPVSPATAITLCEGASQVFTSNFTLGNPTNGSYYLTVYKDGAVFIPSAVVANTITSYPLPLNNVTVAMSGKYKIRIEDGNNGAASCYKEDSVTLVVNAKVVPGTIGTHQTFCGPSTPLALTSTTASTGGAGPITYAWQTSVNGTVWSADIASNTAGYAPGSLAATTYFRRKASSGVCPAVYTDSVLVTINPIPARPTAITGISPACPNSLLTIAGAPPAGIGYFWQGTSATSKLTTMPATAAYDATVSGKYYARAQNTTTLCWSDSTLIDIVINPLTPGTIGDNTPICEGAVIPKIASKTPAAGGNGTFVYQWESTTDTISGTWTNITGTNTLDYTPPAITATTFFRRKVTSGTCPNVTQIVTYIYSPKPGPANPVTGPSPVCVNSTNVYTTTPVTNATSYDWIIPSGAIITAGDKTTSITVTFSTTPGGLITVTPSNACGIGTPSASLNVLVKPLLTPTVTIQGPDSICTGEPALFFVSAASDSGATPTYKWYVNATQQASTKTTFESTTLVNGDVIKVEMTSSEPCVTSPTATSNTLTMVVVGQVTPSVSINPPTFCAGTSTTLTATPIAGGSAPSYVWTLNGGAVGTNSNSYTNAGFVNGDVVKVVMTSNSGCAFPTNVAEREVTLTVKPIPVVTPASATICSGATTSIALTTTPNIAGTTFAWPIPTSATVTGATSGTTASIANQLNTTSNSPQILTYVVTPTANGCVGLPENIAVTVNPIPTVTGVDGSICSGTSTNIALSSNVAAGVTYSWTGTGNGAATGTANPIAETLTNSTTAAANTSYSITATANTCTGPAKLINVKVKPIPVTSGLHAPICSNEAISIALNHNITTPGVSSSYAWTASGSSANVTGYAATGTSNPITGTLSNSGTIDETVTYSIIPTVDGCAGNATPIAVVVKPIPTATASAQAPICGGNPVNIALTSGVTGTTFAWTVVTAGTVTAPAATGSGTPITQTLTNTGVSSNTATYTITPTANGCEGPPITAPVTVNPAPNALATGKAICSGTGTGITITSSTAGAAFTWTSAVTTGTVTGQNPAGGTGSSIAETLTNPNPTSSVLTYMVTASANSCTGAPDTIVMTVKPTPIATTVNSKPVICSGETTSILVSSATSTATFAITAAGGAGSTGISGAPNPQTIAQVLSQTAQTEVTYTILPTAEGCPGKAITDSVIVHPIPVPDAGADAGYCVGDSAFIGAPVSNPAYSYSWTPSAGLSSDTVARPQTKAITPTTYTVMTTLKANPNCKLSDEVKINVSAQFTVNAGPDVLICAKDPVTLSATPAGLVSYVWNKGGTTATINVAPEDTTMYIVTASNGACKAKDTVMVNVKNIGHPTLYIPNSFTPNNDGNNDTFKVKGEGVVEFEGMIFDRWGTMFYKWTEVSKGWDGTLPNGELALEDVYIYSIKVKNLCDKKFRDPRSGTITIIK